MSFLPRILILLLFALCSFAGSREQALPPAPVSPEFSAYWHQGKGEITRYTLEQARYGELRNGDAVLIFVTEDFLADKQVKLETSPDGRPYLPILKLNFTKKFTTGIYPYSMMSSVFSPIEVATNPRALKVTTSAQEWCGHVFTQLNLKGSEYQVESRSYFEREGDQSFALDAALLEDEIWTRLRLAPESLPVGATKIIPGTMSSRLRHIGLQVQDAVARRESIAPDSTGMPLSRYTITYGQEERRLAIDYQTAFPHQIIGWSESYRDGFGAKARRLTTTARRTHQMMLDYWSHNSNADDSLRSALGLGD